MNAKTFKYNGSEVKIPKQEDARRMRLTIDSQAHWFGRDAGGAFFLHDYAYDRSQDLTQVIKNYLDHRLDHQEQERKLESNSEQE